MDNYIHQNVSQIYSPSGAGACPLHGSLTWPLACWRDDKSYSIILLCIIRIYLYWKKLFIPTQNRRHKPVPADICHWGGCGSITGWPALAQNQPDVKRLLSLVILKINKHQGVLSTVISHSPHFHFHLSLGIFLIHFWFQTKASARPFFDHLNLYFFFPTHGLHVYVFTLNTILWLWDHFA